MRIAIVHDWLTSYAGSERVLEQMLICYPNADLFAVVDFVPESQREFLRGKTPRTTFIQNLPFAETRARHYLPLMPLAVEQLNLSSYDLILSSSHAVAKGVLTGPDQIHVSYVHSPIRYAWDLQHQYLAETGLDAGIGGWAAKFALQRLRAWDQRTANGVDYFVANSHFIARRVWKTYRRDARVIHPPVDVSRFSRCDRKEPFFLCASRLVPYKRVDLVIKAFAAMPHRSLVVIGDGPEMSKCRAAARGANNVALLGYQPDGVLVDYMQRAQAYVFAAEEDFGISPVEAQACGTPVIAFGKGGILDTILLDDAQARTGILFAQQTIEGILGALQEFDHNRHLLKPENCRNNALRFDCGRFRSEFSRHVSKVCTAHWERVRRSEHADSR